MAALDPTEAPEADEEGNLPAVPRATLKLVRQRYPDLDEELDDEYLESLMGGSDEDDEDDSEDEEANGGPSDPAKSKKAKAAAALKKLMEAAQEESDSDEEMADDTKPNGAKASKKGKEPATSSDDDDDDESIDSDAIDLEEFVICTLDTERVSRRDCTRPTCAALDTLTRPLPAELPAAHRHHHRPQREGLLPCHGYPLHPPHR
jgi:FK506-binding nuclear protein